MALHLRLNSNYIIKLAMSNQAKVKLKWKVPTIHTLNLLRENQIIIPYYLPKTLGLKKVVTMQYNIFSSVTKIAVKYINPIL